LVGWLCTRQVATTCAVLFVNYSYDLGMVDLVKLSLRMSVFYYRWFSASREFLSNSLSKSLFKESFK
jgi:hypothetical protein